MAARVVSSVIVAGLKVWTGCKGEFNSKGLLVSLVVINNNSGAVVKCMGLVVHTGEMNFEE
ncbi:hypothetical protein G9A89_013368 [Geosiphon pyriformis]|nr:hypothetical protein G9A89_013368 [Geosiphon pyriformis]